MTVADELAVTDEKARQCARAICHEERTRDGDWQYCSAKCKQISRTVHGPRLPPRPGWSWL